jgi:hypothetical protein
MRDRRIDRDHQIHCLDQRGRVGEITQHRVMRRDEPVMIQPDAVIVADHLLQAMERDAR